MADLPSGAKIRVLVVLKPLRWSGADKVLLDAAACLNPDRYQVVYGLISSNPGEEIPMPPGSPVITFKMPTLNGLIWLRFFLELCGVLYRQHIEVIHVNSYYPGNYARLAAWLMGVPIIIDHWHGYLRFNGKRKLLCRLLGRVTDLSFAVSAGVRDFVTAQCRLDPARFKVLYNCIDWQHFQGSRPKAVVREELGLPPGMPVVGLVARLDHWGKGHKELFQAMAGLRDRHPCHALIVGDGRRRGEMEELAAALGLAGIVHFLGSRLDIPDLLAALDILVLPSYSEGSGLAVLEAMTAGLPVVASDVGGLREIVRHEDTGLLVPPRQPQTLAHSLARLLADPDWARAMGDRAREQVRTHFSLERLARELNESYDALTRTKFGY